MAAQCDLPNCSDQTGRRAARAGLATTLLSCILVQTSLAPHAFADPPLSRQIRAHRVTSVETIDIDGRLDEAVWQECEFSGDFVQKEPDEGTTPTRSTAVSVLYDDEALYVGARMENAGVDDIRASLTRRDNVGNSERIIVSLDSYHDRRTAYSFVVTASGVRADYYHPGDSEGWREYSFDPVWEARAATNLHGWTAEMRIPFSQLRFSYADDQIWGINFNRWTPIGNEDVYWVMVPKNETGWSSRFGELVGLQGIRPSRRLELFPYYANDATMSSDRDSADPFDSGRNLATRVGGDIKMGVGPNLTLEATVNPDFGQVEADPAEVNLSAYETFFQERRPFFIEGSQLLTGICGNYYYSRRIGAAPHGEADGDYVEYPDNTTILSAAKLTGRLDNGLSIGGLAALTAREFARTHDSASGEEQRVEVEPLTVYGLMRMQQEFGAEASTVGFALTGVRRDLSAGSSLAAELNRQAYSGGGDWNLRFQGGNYELFGHAGFSHVEGDPAALVDLQHGGAHYFQRPDAGHVEIDSTRSSLAGYTVGLSLQKNSGSWLWEAGTIAESPGFETNDLGQLNSADDIASWANLRYRRNEPGRLFRRYSIGLFADNGLNFGGDRQYSSFELATDWVLRNFWTATLNYGVSGRALSDSMTRGGPLMGTGSGYEIAAGLTNNNADDLNLHTNLSYANDELGGWNYRACLGATLRPGNRWDVTIHPVYQRWVEPRQYIDEVAGGSDATYGRRYLFAHIDRSQLATQLRLNYSFSPDLSLELYAEPFAASGRFFNFGELATAGSRELRTYGTDGTSLDDAGGEYTVTDGADSFTFEQEDFSTFSFRTNLVMRWEWSPGSALFLVWQQDRSDSIDTGEHVRLSSFGDAVTAGGDHFFAIKVSYWLPVD